MGLGWGLFLLDPGLVAFEEGGLLAAGVFDPGTNNYWLPLRRSFLSSSKSWLNVLLSTTTDPFTLFREGNILAYYLALSWLIT